MAAVVRGVTRSLPNASDVAIPYQFRSVATLWTGSVVNSSKTRVSTVQLYLNGAKFALLKRDTIRLRRNQQRTSSTLAISDPVRRFRSQFGLAPGLVISAPGTSGSHTPRASDRL